MGDAGAEETNEETMRARYRVPCEHGYADLTTKAIAEESGKSRALRHYHCDTKEALLAAFLEHLLDNLREKVEPDADADPAEQLTTVLEQFVFGPDDHESSRRRCSNSGRRRPTTRRIGNSFARTTGG